MDTLVIHYINRPRYPQLEEDFGMIAGYDLIMNKEDGQEINLGFIEERLLDTALWFYMLEKTIDIVVVRDGKIVQTIP